MRCPYKLLQYTVVACMLLSLTACGDLSPIIRSPTYTVPAPYTPDPNRPTPDPTRRAEVSFSDSFDQNNSGWSTGEYSSGSASYKNGTFSILAREKGVMEWSTLDLQTSDVIIEVDAYPASEPDDKNDGYGVLCRADEDGNGYLFRVSGDGYVSIFRTSGDEFTPLVDWVTSPLVNLGSASNHINAICQGDSLSIWVNGTLAASTKDSTYATGFPGLTATSFSDAPIEAYFDNFTLRTP